MMQDECKCSRSDSRFCIRAFLIKSDWYEVSVSKCEHPAVLSLSCAGAALEFPEAAGAKACADIFRAEETPASERDGGETGGAAEDGAGSEGTGGAEAPQQRETR